MKAGEVDYVISRQAFSQYCVKGLLVYICLLPSKTQFTQASLVLLWPDDGCFTVETCSPNVIDISSLR